MIHVDETRWPRLGSDAPAAGTVWGVATPTVAFYRILPGKSADEGRQILGGYRGTIVVDGYAVYKVLARDGPGVALAHCWAHTKRKYEANAADWPTACGEIDALIGDLYAVERLVPGPFPGDAAAQALRPSSARSDPARSSSASRRGRPSKSACRAANWGKPSATCSNAGSG